MISTKRFSESLPGIHAVMIDELQAVLDARAAVGNLGEIVFAEDFLVFETERAMVGGDHLQVIVLQAVPEFRLMLLGAQRRREDILGAFEIGPLQLFDGEQQILRAGFGECRHAAVARFAHLVERVFRREVHDVDRRAGDFRHGDGAMHGFGFGARGAGERVIDGRGLAFGQRAARRSRRSRCRFRRACRSARHSWRCVTAL